MRDNKITPPSELFKYLAKNASLIFLCTSTFSLFQVETFTLKLFVHTSIGTYDQFFFFFLSILSPLQIKHFHFSLTDIDHFWGVHFDDKINLVGLDQPIRFLINQSVSAGIVILSWWGCIQSSVFT